MTPKPFGYYGLNLDISTEIELDNLKLPELTDLLDDMVSDLNTTYYLNDDDVDNIYFAPIKPCELSDVSKLALIRGLCDRIEVKLMEEAK